MSAALKMLTVEEFLTWAEAQPVKYEFDGTQPVDMTGGSPMHALVAGRLAVSVGRRLRLPANFIPPISE